MITFWELLSMLSGILLGGYAYSTGGWVSVALAALGAVLGFPVARIVGGFVARRIAMIASRPSQ